jgi:hypothetical protein
MFPKKLTHLTQALQAGLILGDSWPRSEVSGASGILAVKLAVEIVLIPSWVQLGWLERSVGVTDEEYYSVSRRFYSISVNAVARRPTHPYALVPGPQTSGC